MEITKAIRKKDKIISEDIEYENNIFLSDTTKEETTGYILNPNNKQLYFISTSNYFVELKTTLEALKDFLNIFASGGNLGTNGGGALPVDPTLAQKATTINSEIDKLIKQLP